MLLSKKIVQFRKKITSVERNLATVPAETSVREKSSKSGESSIESENSTSKPIASSSKNSKKRQLAAGSPCRSQKKKKKNGSSKSKSKESKLEKSIRIVPLEIIGPKTERVEREPERENFCEMIDKMTVWIQDYLDCPEKYPVSADSLPGFIYQRLSTHPPSDGVPYDTIMADFQEIVLNGVNFIAYSY